MDIHHVIDLAEEHPGYTIGVIVVGGVGILWLLGAFSAAPAQAASADNGLAAAYYNAEAVQAQTGAAIQVAQIGANAQTAQAKIAADASTLNNTTWANVNTTDASYSEQLGAVQTQASLTATQDTNASAVAMNASNNATSATINAQNTSTALAIANQASTASILSAVLPGELAGMGGAGGSIGFNFNGVAANFVDAPASDPALAALQGQYNALQTQYGNLGNAYAGETSAYNTASSAYLAANGTIASQQSALASQSGMLAAIQNWLSGAQGVVQGQPASRLEFALPGLEQILAGQY